MTEGGELGNQGKSGKRHEGLLLPVLRIPLRPLAMEQIKFASESNSLAIIRLPKSFYAKT